MTQEEKQLLEEIRSKLQHLIDMTTVGNVGLSFQREKAKMLVNIIEGLTKEKS